MKSACGQRFMKSAVDKNSKQIYEILSMMAILLGWVTGQARQSGDKALKLDEQSNLTEKGKIWTGFDKISQFR